MDDRRGRQTGLEMLLRSCLFFIPLESYINLRTWTYVILPWRIWDEVIRWPPAQMTAIGLATWVKSKLVSEKFVVIKRAAGTFPDFDAVGVIVDSALTEAGDISTLSSLLGLLLLHQIFPHPLLTDGQQPQCLFCRQWRQMVDCSPCFARIPSFPPTQCMSAFNSGVRSNICEESTAPIKRHPSMEVWTSTHVILCWWRTSLPDEKKWLVTQCIEGDTRLLCPPRANSGS